MGTYAGSSVFHENIYQFDETDVVQGGPDGIDNKPLKDLADRTRWLRDQVGSSTRYAGLYGSTPSTITNSMAGRLITVYSGGILNITLAPVNTFQYGDFVDIVGACASNSVINLLSPSHGIYDLTGTNVIYMHDKEKIRLVAFGDHWNIASANGNFYSAGEEIKGRKVIGNTLPLQGQLLERARYPRLWEYVKTLTSGREITSESSYFSDPYIYRGFFTTGDGSTTFRIPDERGMFERMIDSGRGIDYGRYSNYPGGFEQDELKSHNHTTESFSRRGWPKESGDRTTDYYWISRSKDSVLSGLTINTTGGYETRPKNICKINLIRF